MAASPPPPGRVPVAITCWEGTDPYPTDQPLVNDGGIVTFASDFLGGFDATGSDGGLPRGVEADVAWLRAWALPAEVYYGAGMGPLLPFTCASPVPHVAVPTAAQVVADLHKADFAAAAPGVQLDTDSPPWRRPPWEPTGVDQVHTDEDHNYMFCTAEDLAEDMDDPISTPSEEEMAGAKAVMEKSHEALQALKAHVLGGHVFFVVLHTQKKVWENGEVSDPRDVHLWAVGVSPTSGNLVGAYGSQSCHNLCD